jgi:hypothetical protein
VPQVEKLLVFLASPGDVPTERRHVEEIVADLNRTVASDKGVVLQVLSWENDAFPGYGQDAQALINAQIAEMSKYALFVGIMFNRLGTPTPRAASGTVEEFERAVQASKQNGQPDIWFYFRQSASKLDTEDQLEQRKKVLPFKKEVQANGMPWTYKNPADFRDTFRHQMILWLNARSRTLEPGTVFRDTLKDGSQGLVGPAATERQKGQPADIPDEAAPALAPQEPIREKSAAEIILNLKGITPSYRFHEAVEAVYLGRWTQEPGWQATVCDFPSKLPGGIWHCMFKEVGSGTVVTAFTVQDVSKLRKGDSVTVSGRIRGVSQGYLESVSLEDAIVSLKPES